MSDFTAINAASGVAAATASLTADTTDTIDQEAFLKLFVAQMQNQDPMNPQESSEMAAQLAQYSQVEQLTNLNSSMDKLLEANEHSAKLAALDALGQEVAYKASTFTFDGKPAQIGYQLDKPASEVTVTLSRNGAVAASFTGEELSTGNHYITWDGMTGAGIAAEPGEYTIKVSAKESTGDTFTPKSLVRSEVTGVDLSGEQGGTLQTIAGEVAFASIMGIFEKEAAADTADSNKSSDSADNTAKTNNTDSADSTTGGNTAGA